LVKQLGQTAAPMRSTKPRATCSSNGNALVSLSLCVAVSGPLFVCSFVSVCEGGARRSGYCCGWAAVCCVLCGRSKWVCATTLQGCGAWLSLLLSGNALRACMQKVWLTTARGVQPQGASTKQVSARYLQRKHPWWYLLPRGGLTGRPPVKPCGEGEGQTGFLVSAVGLSFSALCPCCCLPWAPAAARLPWCHSVSLARVTPGVCG
jgi:hypothetical protein